MRPLPYGKILIIDDDDDLTYLLKKFLELKNFKVTVRRDGKEGFFEAEKKQYDLFIIDIGIPYENGLTLIQKLRNKGVYTPSIMITDEYSLEHEIESYRSGTNLFHRKPIEYRLLDVQIRSLLNKNLKDIFMLEDLKVDMESRKVYKNNIPIKLTKLEFNLLVLFLRSNGEVYSRDEILKRIFYNNQDVSNGAVDTLISRLRKKLGSNDSFIETVFKSGYRINNYYINSQS